jgi:hypothetical protein
MYNNKNHMCKSLAFFQPETTAVVLENMIPAVVEKNGRDSASKFPT